MVRKWRVGVCALATLWLGAAGVGRPSAQTAQLPSRPAAAAPTATPQRAVFSQYCVTCHNQRLKQAGTVPIALDGDDLWDVAAHAPTWEKVVLKMRAGVMPPAGSPRPDKTIRASFLGWLESELDRADAARPNPGRPEAFHRLNRAEYRNAIRDLLALDVDVSSMLPADDASYGFDNIGGVLKMSPTLMEQYLAAAQRVSRLAVGTPVPAPSIEYFRITDDLAQHVHLPDLPFGTRGGTQVNYVFPADAHYEIRVDKGAKLDVVNKKGWTPLTAADGVEYTPAVLKRYPEAAALLRKTMRERGMAVPESTQPGAGGAGSPRTAAQDARSTIWDGVFTDVQAKRGEDAYAKSCAKCHAEDLLGSTNAPALVGQPFFARFDRQTADDVIDVIRRTMPQEAPDTLGMPTYADIASYLFKSNGSPAGKTELPADRAKLRDILVTSR